MSKNSSYSDMLAVLQYVDSKKEKPSRFRRKKDTPDLDLLTLLERKKQEAKIIETWIKDQEKINKKEDKDTSWLGKMSVVQRTAFFFFIGPPLGLCYMVLMLQMFKTAAQAVGVK